MEILLLRFDFDNKDNLSFAAIKYLSFKLESRVSLLHDREDKFTKVFVQFWELSKIVIAFSEASFG